MLSGVVMKGQKTYHVVMEGLRALLLDFSITPMQQWPKWSLNFEMCSVSLAWAKKNKMQPTKPNARTYVNGTNVETCRKENLIDVATRGCRPA